MDVVVGLDFTDTVAGLSLDVRVRTLALHQAEEFHGARDVTVVGWDTTPWSPLGLTAWPHFAPGEQGFTDEAGSPHRSPSMASPRSHLFLRVSEELSLAVRADAREPASRLGLLLLRRWDGRQASLNG